MQATKTRNRKSNEKKTMKRSMSATKKRSRKKAPAPMSIVNSAA